MTIGEPARIDFSCPVTNFCGTEMDWDKTLALVKELGFSKDEALKFIEKQREIFQKEREAERAEAREMHAREKEILELKLRLAQATECHRDDESLASVSSGSQSPKANKICPRKLMAPFDEKRDDLDAYLHRFERIALGQG